MRKTILLFFTFALSINLFAQDDKTKSGTDVFVVENQEVKTQGDTIGATLVKPVDAVEVQKKSDKAVKVYENGQLYILRNGKKYNLLGLEVE